MSNLNVARAPDAVDGLAAVNMSVRFDPRLPKAVGLLVHLQRFLRELSGVNTSEDMLVCIHHKKNSLPCSTPLSELAEKIPPEELLRGDIPQLVAMISYVR